MRPGLRFAPDQLSVRAGETVAFAIANNGALPHQFFIGTAAQQRAHEIEMSSGTSMVDEPNGVELPAGGTAPLVYTFDRLGTFGYHLPAH